VTAPNHASSGETPEQQVRDGLISALIAYLLWGVMPLYFILVKNVSPLEVLAHRVIWAVPFGAAIIHFRKQWAEVWRGLTHRKMMLYLSITAILIAGNWLVYIWAVQQDQIFQASLGYYINPLMFAVVGVFMMGEKLRRPQIMAVVLAAFGVVFLAVSGGEIPAIALFLGTSFTIYGVIRKKVVIGGMPGLFIETLVLLPLSIAYVIYLMSVGLAEFGGAGLKGSALLLLAGPITVLPLLFFALATRRLNLSTVGMMQFIAPTMQFGVGVYFGEQLTTAHLVCFGCIWTAVAVFSWDAWRSNRRTAALAS
jgi:chloramphenicol-sensitive protein RarD